MEKPIKKHPQPDLKVIKPQPNRSDLKRILGQELAEAAKFPNHSARNSK